MTATLHVIRADDGENGSSSPRIATTRPNGRSRGPEAVAFAHDVLGLDLLPWQAWVLPNGLVWNRDRWASRTVSVMVGRQNGKTRLVTVRALVGMCVYGERSVIAAAQNRDIALDAWRDALELAEDAGLDVHDTSRTNGRECFYIGDARYKVVSATRRGGRGLSADLVICDEVREYRDFEPWAALEKTRRARKSSQVWAISNEGDEGSVVLDMLSAQGRVAAEARTPTDAAWMEWSAGPELERNDPVAWRQSNPALGHLITADTIASEAVHDDPLMFETEVLCRRVATLRPWLPPGMWDATAEPNASVPDGASVCFALDAGPELRHATITVSARRPDGREHVEAVASFLAADGPVLPRAAERLAALCADWKPLSVAVIARSASEAAALRAVEDTGTPVDAVTGAEVIRAANAFHEAVVARLLVHPPDAMTASHMGAVTADGVMRRRSPSSDIDAAMALVLVRHAVRNAPTPDPGFDWVAF